MARLLGKKKEEAPAELPDLPEPPKAPTDSKEEVRVLERAITLELLNDKLNYITEALHKIAEACEIDL